MALHWRIELFGGLRALRDEQEITRFRTQKAGALLGYLAYHPGQIHSREALADRLWPDCAPEQARNNLRVALASLRRQLEPPHGGGQGDPVILADRARVGLHADAVTTDVGEFENLVGDALARPEKGGASNPATATSMLARAVELYRGPLLAGYYEDWISLEEQRLELLYFRALTTLVECLQAGGQWEQALRFVQHGLHIDPQHAGMRRSLAQLRASVGVASPGAPDLTGDELQLPADLSAAASSGHTTSHGPARLPLPLTRFFGREAEVAELLNFIEDGEVRLVALTGPGGSGKTRLVLELLRRAATTSVPVHFVPLASLSDPGLIIDSILSALDSPRSPSVPVLEQVAAALGTAPVLMVLDNLEQLLPAGAAAVQTLLQRVSGLTLIVTSRQRLDLPGEREWPVAPLAAPATTLTATTSGSAADDWLSLADFPSVQLFINRAQAARPDFQLTKHNAAAIARLLGRLEGLPLAIELVAARSAVLTPAQMLDHLESAASLTGVDNETLTPSPYLNLLQSHHKYWPQRQRALRATIGWSYALLPPEPQQFFARLWVLRGSFRLEAAVDICAEPQALHYLAQLRAASLVVTEESSLDRASSEMRFRLLEPIREFAGEQLSAEARHALQERHARHYLRLAETAERGLVGPDQLAWLSRLEAAADNFRAALAWALDHQPALALSIVASLALFWQIHNHMSEGRSWTVRALEAAGNLAGTSTLRARALLGGGRLAFYAGDFPAAHAQLEASIELNRGDANPGLAAALHTLSHMELNEGNFASSLAHCQESVAICRILDDRPMLVDTLRTLGAIYTGEGRYAEARPPLEEGLVLIRALDDNLALAHTLDLMAFVALGVGDVATAQRSWQDSVAIARDVGDGYLIGKTLWGLGTLARAAGELADARTYLDEAVRIAVDTQNQWMRPFMLEAVAYVAVEQGQFEAAAQLLGASYAIRETLGSPLLPIFLPDYEHYLTRLQAALDAATFDRAWACGKTLSFDQAATVALDCCRV